MWQPLTQKRLYRYNPEAVDRFFNLTDRQRVDLLEEMRSTNYSVVHETLLKDLFQLRYVDGKSFNPQQRPQRLTT